jgi:hypothetical protein
LPIWSGDKQVKEESKEWLAVAASAIKGRIAQPEEVVKVQALG